MTFKQKVKMASAIFTVGAGVVGVAFTAGSAIALALCQYLPFCN